MLLFYAATMLLYYIATMLLFYAATMLLFYFATILLSYASSMVLFYITAILLFNATTMLLFYFATMLLHYVATMLLFYAASMVLFYIAAICYAASMLVFFVLKNVSIASASQLCMFSIAVLGNYEFGVGVRGVGALPMAWLWYHLFIKIGWFRHLNGTNTLAHRWHGGLTVLLFLLFRLEYRLIKSP